MNNMLKAVQLLRANLGLPTEEVVTSGKAAPTRTIDLASSSVQTGGRTVPRTSFGSPIPVTNLGSASPSVNSGAQPFATAAWKLKEPPCFFGRSAEDAHTWVSLVRNYLTFMLGSDAQAGGLHCYPYSEEAAHEWYMSFERRNRGPPQRLGYADCGITGPVLDQTSGLRKPNRN